MLKGEDMEELKTVGDGVDLITERANVRRVEADRRRHA